MECPERFDFAEYSQETWDALSEEAKLAINADDLNTKAYIKECERRVEIHND